MDRFECNLLKNVEKLMVDSFFRFTEYPDDAESSEPNSDSSKEESEEEDQIE